jgi:hypothetical protein
MDNIKEKAQSIAEKMTGLMKKIPGYEGYHEREKRRDADKVQRDFLADNLKKEKGRLLDCSGALVRSAQLEHTSEIDRISKIFDRITDKIRHADYGYAGFFAAQQINEAELDKMIEFDAALANNLATIGESLTALEASIDTKEGIGAKLRAVEKTIKELDLKFDEREKLLKGVA